MPRDLMLQEMGLEPTRCCHRQILSLLRLPFRHSCQLLYSIKKAGVFQPTFLILIDFSKKIRILSEASPRSGSNPVLQNSPSAPEHGGSAHSFHPPSEGSHCTITVRYSYIP